MVKQQTLAWNGFATGTAATIQRRKRSQGQTTRRAAVSPASQAEGGVFAAGSPEQPGYLRLDMERLSIPTQAEWTTLKHNQVVRISGYQVLVWLDCVRGILTVWGPEILEWCRGELSHDDWTGAVLREDWESEPWVRRPR